MRILIFHGYLLRGTGSNVYNAELARALVAAGHDVDLVCQERSAKELEWVDAVGTWDNAGALVVEDLGARREPGRGRCTVFVPPIADRLPIYVQDNYKGFDARTFDQFDDAELEFYIARNVMAVKAVAERERPDYALANHMVMGPYILAQALGGQVPYVAKIHGSAMEYIVRPHPRFLPYARAGVGGARAVLVGSRHIAGRTWDTLRIPELEKRIFLGPPGVDIERFRPARDSKAALENLAEVAERVLELPRLGYGPGQKSATEGFYDRIRTAARVDGMMGYADVAAEITGMQATYETDGIDAAAGDALRAIVAAGDAPTVLYVGKLIVSKGVDLLAAAWPLVRRDCPDARLLVTGFGAYREGLEMLIAALSEGDLVTARWIASGGRAFEGGEAGPLTFVTGLLDSLDEDEDARAQYLEAARGMRDSITFVGRLEHDLLTGVIPVADCQVVPSTFPEAYGMVAAEAAACGVPPISAEHSGLEEVTAQLRENLSGASGALLSFPLSPAAVELLADRVRGALTLSTDQYAELSARLVQTADKSFSWARVARELAAAAEGQTQSLRRP
ncbi:MAG: glycosyltransferase family 4 protein [Thermoleophilaceae bacterium]|nr:glycosyltransferase family 4 protein [Thermoleophilaceae bacterium]